MSRASKSQSNLHRLTSNEFKGGITTTSHQSQNHQMSMNQLRTGSLVGMNDNDLTDSELASKYQNGMYMTRKDTMQRHMDKLMVTNDNYFKHVRGGLVCGTCVRPRELNLDYKKGAESLYQKDFKPHASYKAVPRMGSDFFGGFNTQQPMELTTINRTDYIPHPLEKNPSEKKKDVTQFLPFAGVSSYNSGFVNWGSNPVSMIKPASHPTVIKELPFMGRSMYSDQFQGKPAEKDAERDKIIQTNRRGQFKSPINSDFPFLGQTTNGSTYLPQKTSTKNFKPSAKAESPLPPFDGQYLTTHKKDFTEKEVPCNCKDKNCIICGKKMG